MERASEEAGQNKAEVERDQEDEGQAQVKWDESLKKIGEPQMIELAQTARKETGRRSFNKI